MILPYNQTIDLSVRRKYVIERISGNINLYLDDVKVSTTAATGDFVISIIGSRLVGYEALYTTYATIYNFKLGQSKASAEVFEMSEGSGNTITGSNGTDVTILNGLWYKVGSPSKYKSLTFGAGTLEYITIPVLNDSNAFQLGISGVFDFRSSTGQTTFCLAGNTANNNIIISPTGAATADCIIRMNEASNTIVIPMTNIDRDVVRYREIVVYVTSLLATIYINGSQKGSVSRTDSNTISLNLIGDRSINDGGANGLVGKLSSFSLGVSAVSANKIFMLEEGNGTTVTTTDGTTTGTTTNLTWSTI